MDAVRRALAGIYWNDTNFSDPNLSVDYITQKLHELDVFERKYARPSNLCGKIQARDDSEEGAFPLRFKSLDQLKDEASRLWPTWKEHIALLNRQQVCGLLLRDPEYKRLSEESKGRTNDFEELGSRSKPSKPSKTRRKPRIRAKAKAKKKNPKQTEEEPQIYGYPVMPMYTPMPIQPYYYPPYAYQAPHLQDEDQDETNTTDTSSSSSSSSNDTHTYTSSEE